MKQSNFVVTVCVATLFSFTLGGCSKDDDQNNNTDDLYNVSAAMSAANETGAGTSAGNTTAFPGTGTVTGKYNATTNELQYNVTWSGLSGQATGGHLHGPALPGANAGVVIPFNLLNNGTSGSASGTITITDTQETDLLAGKWYANIHTAANAGGEIRGQVAAAK